MLTLKQISAIKAALWTKGDIEELTNRAIHNFFGEDMRPVEDVVFSIHGKRITIKNIPHIKRGDEVYEDLRLLATIERVLEEVKELPDVIELSSLISARDA